MSLLLSSAEKLDVMNSLISLSSEPKTETLCEPRRCSPPGMPGEGEGEDSA